MHLLMQVVEFKQRMEMWGLLRLALSAARVALSRSGLAQVAAKSFTGLWLGYGSGGWEGLLTGLPCCLKSHKPRIIEHWSPWG